MIKDHGANDNGEGTRRRRSIDDDGDGGDYAMTVDRSMLTTIGR